MNLMRNWLNIEIVLVSVCVMCALSTRPMQGCVMSAKARVSSVSWERRSHAVLFKIPLGLSCASSISQALQLPFEY